MGNFFGLFWGYFGRILDGFFGEIMENVWGDFGEILGRIFRKLTLFLEAFYWSNE